MLLQEVDKTPNNLGAVEVSDRCRTPVRAHSLAQPGVGSKRAKGAYQAGEVSRLDDKAGAMLPNDLRRFPISDQDDRSPAGHRLVELGRHRTKRTARAVDSWTRLTSLAL